MNIYIIGAGNIGCRHIQSTLLLSQPFDVHVVEINPKNLNTARSITINNEISTCSNYYYFDDELPKNKKIDLLYLATTASNRFKIFSTIIKTNLVSNIIFEKVIFQKPEQYFQCQELLTRYEIRSWVNNWHRTTTYFREIKKILDLEQQLTMKVLGKDWGIGCNISHYMDLFLFLTETTEISELSFRLDELFDSKRSGFKEFYGTMSISIKQKYFLEISDSSKFPQGLRTSIYNGTKTVRINENHGKVTVKSNIKEISNKIFDEPLQSMTSHIHMQAIVDNSSCLLPSYDKVYEWHAKTLTLFNEALGIKKGEVCPIT